MKVLKGILKALLIIVIAIVLIIGSIIGFVMISSYLKDREFEKYGGHGFDYMHGYSSTDLTGYHVYDGDKLVKLNHEPEFMIENIEEMPILDGAEACYPVYTAIAKTLYKDIDKIEQEIKDLDNRDWTELSQEERDYRVTNGRVVTFTNTKDGYYRLIDGYVDLFIGARPSSDQKAQHNPMAKQLYLFQLVKKPSYSLSKKIIQLIILRVIKYDKSILEK